MSNFDSPQYVNDKLQPQAGSDLGTTTPLVNMANFNDVQSVFGRSYEGQTPVVSSDGQMIFSDPFKSGDNNWNQNNWTDGDRENDWRGRAAQKGTDGSASQTVADTNAGALSTATDTTAGGATSPSQQLELQITQLQAQLTQMSAEVSQLIGDQGGSSTAGSDSASAPAATSGNPNYMPLANTTPSSITETSSGAPAISDATPTVPASSDTNAAPLPTANNDTSTAASPPADSSTDTASGPSTETTVANPSGGYNVINGQIIGPNGQAFDAVGVAVGSSTAQTDAAAILNAMPNLNFIRLAAYPGQDTPADIQADIQAFQNINPNVVVEVQDATSNGGDATTTNTLTGQALTNEENWYAQIASANVNNPNVWFATANEPNDATNEQNVVNQEVGIYNAVRGTGSNAMVMLEANLGALFGPQQADPNAYAAMTNVAWDDHYYGWETQGTADGGQSVQENVQGVQNEIAGAAGITESDGAGGQQAIPTIIGEYGNATTGLALDPNGTAAVDGVQIANNEGLVQGAVAWAWDQYNPPGDANAITTSEAPTKLTPYGQEIVNYVNAGTTGVAE